MAGERDPSEVCALLQETLQRFFGGQATYVRLEPGKAGTRGLRVGVRMGGRDVEVSYDLDGYSVKYFAEAAKSACRSLAWKAMHQMAGLALKGDQGGN